MRANSEEAAKDLSFIKSPLDGSMHPCNLTLGLGISLLIVFKRKSKSASVSQTTAHFLAGVQKKSLHSVSVSFYFISLFFCSIW